jgi:hypothetical protein
MDLVTLAAGDRERWRGGDDQRRDGGANEGKPRRT